MLAHPTKPDTLFRSRVLGICLLGLGLLVASSCSRSTIPPIREPAPAYTIVVTIPPLAGLTRALMPETTIQTLIKPGQSPHTFEISPHDRALLTHADLVVAVGMGIEAGLPDSLLDAPNVLRMDQALAIAAKPDDPAHPHSHHNPHLWLDLQNVKTFIPMLANRIIKLPTHNTGLTIDPDQLRANEQQLLDKLDRLDQQYAQQLAPYAGAALIAHHNAWSPLLARYQLTVVGTIETAEDTEPSPAHIAHLLDSAREQHVRAIIIEPQLSGAIAQRLARQLDIPIITLDPLGHGDWLAMMHSNLDAMVTGLQQSSAPDASTPDTSTPAQDQTP